MKKKILIISFSNLLNDPRVRRQVFALYQEYDLTVLGYNGTNIDGVNDIVIKKDSWNVKKRLLQRFYFLTKQYLKAYNLLSVVKEARSKLQTLDFDLIIANDIEAVPLAKELKKALIIDLHEYAPKQFENDFWWRFYFSGFKDYLCKNFLFKEETVLTVSEGLKKEYDKNYETNCEIITNATVLSGIEPSSVDKDRIRIIHHGIVSESRSLHLMIEMMDFIDERFELDLMLVETSHKSYFVKLKEMVNKRNNVNIIKPVEFDKIVSFCNDYDVGLFLVPPTTYNLKYCLPNKFFEFIQSRLMIAIGPSIEMEKIVRKHNIGVVSDDFNPESLAKKLNILSASDIINMKNNTDKIAKIFNSDINAKKLNSIVKSKICIIK